MECEDGIEEEEEDEEFPLSLSDRHLMHAVQDWEVSEKEKTSMTISTPKRKPVLVNVPRMIYLGT